MFGEGSRSLAGTSSHLDVDEEKNTRGRHTVSTTPYDGQGIGPASGPIDVETRPGRLGLDPQLQRLAVVVVLGAIMSILDTTIVNVAIDTLAKAFDSPLSTIQWVSTGYLLALAMVIPLTGWAVERFGSKKMWIMSLTIFLLGSALSGAAWSAESLIAFRILQGVGGGMIMPIGQSILADAAGPQRMGRVMSLLGVPMLLGPVLGPVIGGLIIDSFTWRWIFYVNIPIGIVAIIMAIRVLPTHERSHEHHRLDTVGLLLLSPGLALLVYGLSEAGQGSDLSVFLPVAVGAVLVVAFVLHALRAKIMPLIEVALFRDRSFTAAAVTTFCFGAALYGAMLLLPLYYQVVRGDERAERRSADGSSGHRRSAGDAVGREVDRSAGRREDRSRRADRGHARDPRLYPVERGHLVRGAGHLAVRPGDRLRLRDDAGHRGGVRDP